MTYQINGNQGKYDNYSKNAIDNNFKYMEAPLVNDKHTQAPILDFGVSKEAPQRNIEALEKFADENDAYLKSLPPLEYEYRYMPEGPIDKAALFTTAREELGADEMSVEEFENKFLPDEGYTAKPLDINKDGKIDVKEYGANILAADILSKDNPKTAAADGTIKPKGFDAVLEYSRISRASAAADLYANIYNSYNLGE